MIDHQAALIYTMVLTSSIDGDVDVSESGAIGGMVRHLPVFEGFDAKRLPSVWKGCMDILTGDDGVEKLLAAICAALPEILRETAYALACDVAAADGHIGNRENHVLETLRQRLGIGEIIAEAIEHGARARFATY